MFASPDLNPPPQKINIKKLEKLAKRIAQSVTRSWTIMEVSSGQTRTLLENNLTRFLPDSIRLVHGPGCAICATPLGKIDKAIRIAQQDDVIFCCSAELLRLKGSECDLLEIKASGADVRVVHSPLDSVGLARKSPGKKVVFFTIGFETKAELNALSVWQAKRLGLNNFYLLASHPSIAAACRQVIATPSSPVQGLLGPGEVCTVTGFEEYEQISEERKLPIVVTGFEPTDILEGIYSCVKLLEAGKADVRNQYERGVSRSGNQQAKALIGEVFEIIDLEWRGIGTVNRGGYSLRREFRAYDAEREFPLNVMSRNDSSQCISNQILLGLKRPTDCQIFAKSCLPGNPQGATMVSNQGTCFTYYNFRHNH